MHAVNTVTLIGVVGQDPVIKKFENSTLVKYMIGVEEYNGKETVTEWHPCSQFVSNTNPYVINNVKKGAVVAIAGRVSNRMVEDETGNHKYYYNVDVKDLKVLRQANKEAF